MPQLQIIKINGAPAVQISNELLKEMGWVEGDCINVVKVGHALHFSKVVVE